MTTVQKLQAELDAFNAKRLAAIEALKADTSDFPTTRPVTTPKAHFLINLEA